jgi:gliding motility-associated-like protein
LSQAQNRYIRGKAFLLYSTRSAYVVVPTPVNVRYEWSYSDTTLQNLREAGEDTMWYYAFPSTNDGIITCKLFDLATDTLQHEIRFPLKITKSFVNVASLAPLKEECALIYNDNNDCSVNYIDYVELESIRFVNDSCSFGGYQDLTTSGYTTELEMGMNYTITLKPKNVFFDLNGQIATLYYGVWLDYNNDGDFQDPGEFIKYGESNSKEANLLNIQILNNNAFVGPRRLRIAMKGAGGFSTDDVCSVVGNSEEREDYIVTIKPQGSLQGPNLLTPNNDGKNDFLIIKGIDPDQTKTRLLYIYTTQGKLFRSIESYSNDFDGRDEAGHLPPPGTYYYVFINQSRKLSSFYQLEY